MAGHGRVSPIVIGAGLCLALSACGGGTGSAGASSFAQAIGLSPSAPVAPAPSPTPTPTPTPTPSAPPVNWINAYWVDYANGSDTNDGRSKAAAWKHAPGDPQATGVPAATTLKGGDHLVFAAGVRYYGSITAQFQGTAISPIVIEGESKDQSAVIDGSSHSANTSKCASQAACFGVAAWQNVSIATFAEPLPEGAIFYADGQMLTPAQWPDPEDLFYASELKNMADVAGVSVNAGRIAVPQAVAGAITSLDALRVAVWVQPNLIAERPVTQLKNGEIHFDASGLKGYTDRTDKFALRGHASLISKTGEFAIMPDRKTVLFLTDKPGVPLVASTGRGGIDLSGASNVVVRNLSFENFSDIEGNIRSGIPIWAMRAPAENLTIEDNRFANLFMANGQGAITIQRTAGLTVRGNAIARVADGSGMRLSLSQNLTVENNLIERIGRTGIMLMNNQDSLLVRNRIRDIMGVHGNGISVYLGNQRTQVIANTVTEAYQPVTIKGNAALNPQAEDLYFANNLLVTTPDSLGAFISWGSNGNKITLYNNVVLGAQKGSMRLSSGDRMLTARRNVIDGMAFTGAYPADWKIADNFFRIIGVMQAKGNPSDQVTAALAPAFNERGAAPSNLTQFCPYITEVFDYTPLSARYARNVGADFTCS